MPAKWVAFKASVRCSSPLSDDQRTIIRAAQVSAPELGGDTLVVTSLEDGAHQDTSAHYYAAGVDFRVGVTHDVGGIFGDFEREKSDWVRRLQKALGPEYHVIDEGDHLHAERDRNP